MMFDILNFNVLKGVSLCLMIQNYSGNTTSKNRCDQVGRLWDKLIERCELPNWIFIFLNPFSHFWVINGHLLYQTTIKK